MDNPPSLGHKMLLRFFATQPHPCSYLEEKEATTLFADPAFPMDAATYSQLATRGFRRSGQHIYRPFCDSCKACVPLRIPVTDFRYDRQQKRCWRRNQDLSIQLVEDIRSGEHYRLYANYLQQRHRDGDMYPPNREQYDSFLATPVFHQEQPVTHYIEFRKGQQLLAVAVADILASGLSAVYTFYEPTEEDRSLGVFAVLFQVELTRRLQLPHLYLGYWIQQSRKMSYKSRYRPHQLLLDGRWTDAE